jgi:hypothetical protein
MESEPLPSLPDLKRARVATVSKATDDGNLAPKTSFPATGAIETICSYLDSTSAMQLSQVSQQMQLEVKPIYPTNTTTLLSNPANPTNPTNPTSPTNHSNNTNPLTYQPTANRLLGAASDRKR